MTKAYGYLDIDANACMLRNIGHDWKRWARRHQNERVENTEEGSGPKIKDGDIRLRPNEEYICSGG